jgi:hypothetical protein
LSIATALVLIMTSVGVQAESHVRIVRLSYTDGHVQMDRAAGQGLERAMLNAPIIEGTRIVTGDNGLAEVEFEDQSTLRLTDNSEVKFRQLLINNAGNKVNEIEVVRGIVYFDAKKSDDIDRLIANGSSFLVQRNTEIRLSAASDQVRLAVFHGDVRVENQAQPMTVKKKETLTIAADKPTELAVSQGVDGVSTDAWANERSAYASTYASTSNFGGPNVSVYGSQDLNYYGNYFYAPGYGYAWQPYGVAGFTGWNPYGMGAWMYNAGLGYSFASPYPWGWLPFHYGSWAYLPNAGWAWLPGNGSAYKGTTIATNYQPTPKIVKAPAGFSAPTPPLDAASHTVVVGRANGTAYIAGGRVPPDFRSVISPTLSTRTANSKVQTGSTFAAANAKNVSVHNDDSMAHASVKQTNGHVFAPPARSAGVPSDWSNIYNGIGPSSRAPVQGTMHGTPSAPSTAGHASGGNGKH